MDSTMFNAMAGRLGRRLSRRGLVARLAKAGAGACLAGALLLAGVVATPVAMAQQSDMDGDGLFDDEESLQYGTSPFAADTDGDLLDDRQEVVLGTDPRDPASPGPGGDIDGDGLPDADEVNVHGTDMNSPDSDQDGASDGAEIAAGTNPLVAQEFDSDGDGLTDRQETFTHLTNELQFDTDGDGIGDGQEVSLGLDPHTVNLPDPVGPAPRDTTADDSDGDGLSDFVETEVWGTDPNDGNTDNDFLGRWLGGRPGRPRPAQPRLRLRRDGRRLRHRRHGAGDQSGGRDGLPVLTATDPATVAALGWCRRGHRRAPGAAWPPSHRASRSTRGGSSASTSEIGRPQPGAGPRFPGRRPAAGGDAERLTAPQAPPRRRRPGEGAAAGADGGGRPRTDRGRSTTRRADGDGGGDGREWEIGTDPLVAAAPVPAPAQGGVGAARTSTAPADRLGPPPVPQTAQPVDKLHRCRT